MEEQNLSLLLWTIVVKRGDIRKRHTCPELEKHFSWPQARPSSQAHENNVLKSTHQTVALRVVEDFMYTLCNHIRASMSFASKIHLFFCFLFFFLVVKTFRFFLLAFVKCIVCCWCWHSCYTAQDNTRPHSSCLTVT